MVPVETQVSGSGTGKELNINMAEGKLMKIMKKKGKQWR